MYPYKQPHYPSNSMYPHRVPIADFGDLQPERPQPASIPCRQPVNQRRNRIHYTGYNIELTTIQTCRCARPGSHGDAWSFADGHSDMQYTGIRLLDLQGGEIDYNELIHRCLDHLGKDFVDTKTEVMTVYRQVLHPDTMRALYAQQETANQISETGQLEVGNRIVSNARVVLKLPYDAIWYGPVNPKGCRVWPPPEQSHGLPWLSANGAWNPVTGRAMTGREVFWGQRRYGRRGVWKTLTLLKWR
jgi:hypothetical protein